MAPVKRTGSVSGHVGTPKGVIECLDDDDDDVCLLDDDTSPLRPIFCLKKKSAIKLFEAKEDCFILDFNPEDDDESSFDHSKLPLNVKDSPDIFVIAEKGQVANRDYPHSRHLCVNHPFDKTPHESYCQLCYCYVCDIAAPCKWWCGSRGHCHAVDSEAWKGARKFVRKNP